jgi:5-formyltetrahydrofolate cyclo-ligase
LTPLEDVARQKAALRRRMLALRATQDPACGAALAAHVLRDLIFLPGSAVAGVWPLPGEMDLRPLWHALHARGHTVLLPETPPRGSPLLFRVWYPGCAMIPERFGTARPDGPIRTPDYIFVPLLAFDRAGNRIGYGGGYYDMTLAAHRGVPAVGFAYAAQEVPAVPAEAHDIRLGAIMTEQGPVVLSPVSDDAGHCEPLRSNPG